METKYRGRKMNPKLHTCLKIEKKSKNDEKLERIKPNAPKELYKTQGL